MINENDFNLLSTNVIFSVKAVCISTSLGGTWAKNRVYSPSNSFEILLLKQSNTEQSDNYGLLYS